MGSMLIGSLWRAVPSSFGEYAVWGGSVCPARCRGAHGSLGHMPLLGSSSTWDWPLIFSSVGHLLLKSLKYPLNIWRHLFGPIHCAFPLWAISQQILHYSSNAAQFSSLLSALTAHQSSAVPNNGWTGRMLLPLSRAPKISPCDPRRHEPSGRGLYHRPVWTV